MIFTVVSKVLCTELNHEEFEYELEVNNHSSKELQGVFRIFLAPVSNEFNEPLTLPEQRKFFMELDKFHIERESSFINGE